LRLLGARGGWVLLWGGAPGGGGAAVRNFGHGCFTAQDGDALGYALDARDQWLRLAKETGLWLRESGTVVVARAGDELEVLEQFAGGRDGAATLLSARESARRLPTAPDDVIGGAFLPLDVRVDPRAAVGTIADWVASRPGAQVAFATTVQRFEPGADDTLVRTSRGDVRAGRVVVAVGHDVDRFFPGLAATSGVRRCTLHMLRVALPGATAPAIDPAVLTGTSLLRYPGFSRTPAAADVRARLARDSPALLDAGVNLMLTQRPDGTVTLGDTHAYATTPAPYRAEELDALLLTEGAALFGLGSRDLRVLERWRGVYASAPEPFLVADALPGVRVVSVTSGIGMTTALGLAPRVLAALL
jgi:D-hydroxyproline dehydrogenase subunit beta